MVSAFLGKGKLFCAALALLFAAGSAQAQQKAAIVIYNPTDVPLIYEVKWNGDWQRFTVPPKKESAHWINLIGDERLANPLVRFDYICGDDDVTYKEYSLDFYRVDDAFRGRTYFFQFDSTGRILDLLYEVGK